MAAKRSIEPLLWLLFSAGGVMAALFIPVLLLLFGVLIPLGWVSAPSHAHLLAVLSNPLTRVFVFLLCMLSLFLFAHRFRSRLHDGLRIKPLNWRLNAFWCGGAGVGSIVVWYLFWNVP